MSARDVYEGGRISALLTYQDYGCLDSKVQPPAGLGKRLRMLWLWGYYQTLDPLTGLVDNRFASWGFARAQLMRVSNNFFWLVGLACKVRG